MSIIEYDIFHFSTFETFEMEYIVNVEDLKKIRRLVATKLNSSGKLCKLFSGDKITTNGIVTLQEVGLLTTSVGDCTNCLDATSVEIKKANRKKGWPCVEVHQVQKFHKEYSTWIHILQVQTHAGPMSEYDAFVEYTALRN